MRLALGQRGGAALLFGLVMVGSVVVACADAEVDEGGPSPDAGGSSVSIPDAGTPDVSEPEDAAVPEKDAEVDAGPKTCSDHGFCPTELPPNETVRGLWGDGTGIVWAVTEQGKVLRWDGSSWSVHASGLGKLATIWGSSPTEIWIGGAQGIKRGTGESSAELSFASVTIPSQTPPIRQIWGPAADDLWAVASQDWGGAGSVLHYDGATWTRQSVTATDVGFSHVWGGHGTVWVGGSRMSQVTWTNEVIVFYKSPSGKFEEITLPQNPDPTIQSYRKYTPLVGGVVSSSTSVTVLGQPQSSFETPSMWQGTSVDGGNTFEFTWAPDPRADRPVIYTLTGTGGDDVWAAGELGRLIRWNGKKWSTVAISIDGHPTFDPFYALWMGSSNEFWVAGKGRAHRFDAAYAKGGAK